MANKMLFRDYSITIKSCRDNLPNEAYFKNLNSGIEKMNHDPQNLLNLHTSI